MSSSVSTETPSQVPPPISKPSSMNRGKGDAQRREVGSGDEPHSINCKDKVIRRGKAPSMSFSRGPSNFKIDDSNRGKIHGNTKIIRFGDGKFTKNQRNLICDLIANHPNLPDINRDLNRPALIQVIKDLPRAEADFETKKKSGPCFEGTRVELLREMADWATSLDESRVYVLSGRAGIGKSTVAYTIASRAANLNLLGASFFFSRDESERENAKKFFTTIAYQLCIYNETFAKAMGKVLQRSDGSAAIRGGPQEQVQVLIVEPLQDIVRSRPRPILIVVDALDECDEQDVLSVLAGLRKLIRALPSFKVILTTRPQPRLDPFLVSRDGHKIFRLHDIEDKVADGDIRFYLSRSLSLEKVQEHFPTSQWCASDKQVDALARAAGRLFMVALTIVRIILDKVASNPVAQTQGLLDTFAQTRMPFKDLDEFYTVILRNVIPADCDVNIVNRYKSIVGAIICVQHPLPITALAHLIDIDVEEIRTVLVNLRSLILLGDDDIPRVCHKSFPDYITDQALCKNSRFQIDTRIHHTQIATRCFEIMDKHLKRNILGLGDPARFMSNKDGIKADGITDEQVQKKISQQLRYACTYWVNHLEATNIDDEAPLMNGLERFAHGHMLYWLEVLSLIEQLDLAHCAIGVVVKRLTSIPSDLHQLLSDPLHFISKFYEIIKQSSLHTYYSALPFTPKNTLLYRQYIKEAEHNICSIEGMPEKWDPVANLRHGGSVKVIKFSLDSTLFVSCAYQNFKHDEGELKIWDVATGTPISTIPGDTFAIANDFFTVASSLDNIATLYNMNGSPNGTMFKTSSKIYKLALSSENSRIAAALDGGTVLLWDSGSAELIDRFDGFGGRYVHESLLQFSCTGTRLAYTSANGIKLRDGIGGGFIADLQCRSMNTKFEFSGDGSRIASLTYDDDTRSKTLWMWNSENGGLIVAVSKVGWSDIAISANGCHLATAYRGWRIHEVALWSENHESLDQIDVLKVDSLDSMAFSLDNILAIATPPGIMLYNVNTRSLIHTLRLGQSRLPPAFSPDSTRLAVWDHVNVNLWDIRGISACGLPSKRDATAITALTLSRDCSRLACGLRNGTVKLWETSPTNFTNQRFGILALRSEMEKFYTRIFCQSRYMSKSVLALGFDPNVRFFASGWDDGAIELWNGGGDGVLCGTVKVPHGFMLQAIALSNSMLVATWYRCEEDYDLNAWYDGGVTLWSLDALSPIHTFEISGDAPSKVSIAENSRLIAVHTSNLQHNRVTLFDTVNRTTISTFRDVSSLRAMAFLPDNSHLVVQSYQDIFQSINLINNRITEGPRLEHLVQLPNTPLWRPGVPIWHCKGNNLAALFSQHQRPVPVLWIPEHIYVIKWTEGSSMIALGCDDGRVILLRLPTSHVI